MPTLSQDTFSTARTARHPLAAQVLEAVRQTVPQSQGIHEPELLGNELAYLKECLDTNWVSSAGPFVTRFENMVADYVGSSNAIATISGTAALHIALQVAGVRQSDEVVMPTTTFVATANAVAYLKALPHFADSIETNFGLDVERLSGHLAEIAQRKDDGWYNRNTGRRLAAVVCMHVFGHPVDLDALAALCEQYGLPLIEDAAEALGSLYKHRHVGRHGVISAFSFNGNKIATSGSGGALVTDDEILAKHARHLSSTAKTPSKWEFFHDEVGYNYRLPNLNAALGCAQLERMDQMLSEKRRLAELYIAALDGISGLRVLKEEEHARSNYWLNTIVLDAEFATCRDELLDVLNNAGYASRPLWTPMHMLPMYKDCPRMDLSVAESLYHRTVNLPSSARLARGLD